MTHWKPEIDASAIMWGQKVAVFNNKIIMSEMTGATRQIYVTVQFTLLVTLGGLGCGRTVVGWWGGGRVVMSLCFSITGMPFDQC